MLIQKRGFSCSWECLKRLPKTKSLFGVIQFLNWQSECISEFIKNIFSHKIMNAPTGSGKSKAISCSVLEELSRSNKKAIIAVPQKVIGGGFTDVQKFKLKDGTIVDYLIQDKNNLCAKLISEKSKVLGLINFLKDSSCVTLSDRIVLCTHQTLTNAFKVLKKEGDLSFLDNTALWIDEAHHIMGDSNSSNHIGKVTRHYLKNKEKGLSLNLATATLFRGDRASIIPKEYEDAFIRYNLPYDRHFEENCKGLSFSYDFLLHDKDWLEAVKLLFADKVGKTIVFIPHPNSRNSTGDKYEEVKNVIQIIAGRKNPKITEDSNGVLYVTRQGKQVAIVDVVEESGREKKLDYLRNNPDSIDVVIGINVPKEGFDWPCADREIIIGVKDSLNELIQMIGRTFRYHPDKEEGKTVVEIIQVFPFVNKDKLDEGKLRDQLNDLMKQIYCSLILESIFNPIFIKIPFGDGCRKAKRVNPIQEYIIKKGVTDIECVDLMEDVIDILTKYQADNPDIPKKEAEEAFSSLIEIEINKNKKINEGIPYIIKSFIELFKRRTRDTSKYDLIKKIDKSMSGMDISIIDADIIETYGMFGFIQAHTNGICDGLTLREFRSKINCREYLPFKEAKTIVHGLGIESYVKWFEYVKINKLPNGIPITPHKFYKNLGWKDWGDWLGTGIIATQNRKYLSFEEARKIVRSLGLNNQKEWGEYCKSGEKPDNIPANPNVIYRDSGWVSTGDWLGTGNVACRHRKYLSYKEAKEVVHKLGIKKVKGWRECCKEGKIPENIPATPNLTYKGKGWVSWGDFFGTKYLSRLERKYLSYPEAKKVMHTLGIRTQMEFKENYKLGKIPKNIHSNPYKYYKDSGWIGIRDFLGHKKEDIWLSYGEAKEVVHKLGFKSKKEWGEYCKSGGKPDNIPATPNCVYKDKGWVSWGDWLGTNFVYNKYREYLSIEEAKRIVHKLGFKSPKKWKEYSKTDDKHKKIPADPYSVYKNKGWISWPDFLGYKNDKVT